MLEVPALSLLLASEQVHLSLLPCPRSPSGCLCHKTSSITWTPAPITAHQSSSEHDLFPITGRCWGPAKENFVYFCLGLGNCVPVLASLLSPLQMGGLCFLHSHLCW